MNNQIKQFAEAAGLQWKTPAPHFTNTDNPIDFPKNLNTALEKFAEAIILECIAQAIIEEERFYTLGAEQCAKAMENFQELLKEHFGVEE